MTPTMIRGLQAMAQADESPQERDIARAKLAEAGVPIDPPRPPAPPAAAPMPMPSSWHFTSSAGTVTTNYVGGGTIWIRMSVS